MAEATIELEAAKVVREGVKRALTEEKLKEKSSD